jgi:hypothetical protein
MGNHLFIAAIFVLASPLIRAMEIPTAQADVTMVNDRFELSSADVGSMVAVGDFNGDGYDDFAISLLNADRVETEVDLVLGGNFPAGLAQGTALHILTPTSNLHQIGFGDIDNDGKDDLFIAMQNPAKNGVAVLFGRTLVNGVKETIDLKTHDPDVMLEGGFLYTPAADASFAFADYTGDGIPDLALGLPLDDGYVYLIPGRTRESFAPVLNVSIDPSVRLIKGPTHSTFGTHVFWGNVIGDDAPDLIVSAPAAGFAGRVAAGKLFMVDGSRVFPPIWDMQTSTITADIEIGGETPTFYMHASGLGDMNGDGLVDMLINLNQLTIAVLNGSLLDSHPLIDFNPTSPNYIAPVPVSSKDNGNEGVGGDFDGDGQTDFFCTQIYTIELYLTSGITSWPSFPASFETPWVIQSETGYLRKAAFGDFNGDGFDDLLMAEEAHGDYWGALHIIYGFKPLDNPMVHAKESIVRTTKVTVDLGVSGDPTEMKLSGDIVDSFKDQWIPYGTAQAVTLSPDAGLKNIEAVFRNAFHRESLLATGGVTLTVEENGTEVATNLITANQTARINVNLSTTGRIKAVVFTRSGEQVVALWNEERGPGIWPVNWDGTNRDGRRVAPGVYVMVIEAGGQTVKEKILVKE